MPDETTKELCPWAIAVLIARHLATVAHPLAAVVARAVIVQLACMLRPNKVLALRVDACYGMTHTLGKVQPVHCDDRSEPLAARFLPRRRPVEDRHDG